MDAIESLPGVSGLLKLKEGLSGAGTCSAEGFTISADRQDAQHDYEKRHVFSYSLKNVTQKDIRLVDASITFSDRLGNELTTIKVLQDVLYPPGTPVPVKGTWPTNTWKPEEARLRVLNHDDVIPTLTVHKVVFADNTIWAAEGR